MASPAGPRFLLDTNVVIHLARRNPLGLWVEAHYNFALPPAPLISMVTDGELRSLALQLHWGPVRQSDLQSIVGRLILVPLDHPGLMDAYARIDYHCKVNGHALSKNDVWIAATASATGARLLTTDRDFELLHGVFLDRDYIDPAMPL